ncbi:MAG: GAF domain-containing protein [Cyanobacteria bacterium P01_G01_bin.39]
MSDKSWLNKFWSLIKVIILSIITFAISGTIGNSAYDFYKENISNNNSFSNLPKLLIQKTSISYFHIVLIVFFVFFGGILSTLIIRFRYVQAFKKSEELFNIKQDYLDLINNICSGKNDYSFKRIVQSYIEDIVSFYPNILGAAVFVPVSENPTVLGYVSKYGVTLRNLSEDQYYPESNKPEERGAVGEAFHKKEHIIVSISRKKELEKVRYEADSDVYIFPQRNNRKYPGYKSMIAVPILTYNSENKRECHGVISFYSEKKNFFNSNLTKIFNSNTNINENVNTELGSLVNNLYVAKFLQDLTK